MYKDKNRCNDSALENYELPANNDENKKFERKQKMKTHIHTWNDFDKKGNLICSTCGIKKK